jgi:Leucine-rich repeat (LRR) protein
MILPARVAILCPEGCTCDRGGNFVQCSGISSTAVPLFQLTIVRDLSLSYYEITLLKKDSFVSLTDLEVLHLYNCGLRTIEFGAFNGLTQLTGLALWHNNITEKIPGTFENISSLEYLWLNNNRLQHLDRALFSGLVNLNLIGLEGNQIQYLNPDTFLGLPILQKLLLGYNPTLPIPTDRNFINSHSLSHLYISNCNVSSLSVETFANVSALESLRLRHNNLRTLDILTALPNLSTLYLDGNPLQCDCELQEVWRWCKDRNIETVYEGLAYDGNFG